MSAEPSIDPASDRNLPGGSDGAAASEAPTHAELAAHQQPDHARAAWQLVNSVGGYLLAWVLLFFAVDVSWWLAAPLAVVAAGLLVRVFIIMHDCGHGSFVASRKANDRIGVLCGALAFTPYFRWRYEHAHHHATSGSLDKRGVGDIWTLTVAEYRQSSKMRRLGYRLTRNPFCLFGVGPYWLTGVKERIPWGAPNRRARRSVWWTNLFVAAFVALGVFVFGWRDFSLLLLIVVGVSGAAGIWLFYIQHQYEDAYWVRGDEWNAVDAALRGSSYNKLPRLLQWFSGNIGFHHVHHLSPRIPNYRLERCHASTAAFENVPVLTLRRSLRTLSLRLWDESAEKLVGFGRAR